MEVSEVSDTGVSSLGAEMIQPSISLKESKNFINGSANYENVILEEMDSYLEDIDSRLLVSRMVSDSVIKGMVNAASEEAAEKIASKEKEVALLSERLHYYESGVFKEGLQLLAASIKHEKMKAVLLPESGQKWNHIKKPFADWKLAMEDQLQRLKKGAEEVRGLCGKMNLGQQGNITEKCMEMEETLSSLKDILRSVYEEIDNIVIFSEASCYECQWEKGFQEEVNGIVFQSYVSSLRNEFEGKLLKQRSDASVSQNNKWLSNIKKLSGLHEELDAVSRSLFSPEIGKLQSLGSHEFADEWTNGEKSDRLHRKITGNHLSPSSSLWEENGIPSPGKSDISDNETPEATESLGLKCMSSDELISYFRTEKTKMKRNHEKTVQKLTEDNFSLKREILNEKRSSHLRKDKELDALRKKIPEIIIKLNDILIENEESSVISDEYKNVCYLNDKVNNLLSENQRMADLLSDKEKEVKFLASQVSDVANKMSYHSLAEANLLKQIKKLKSDMEDVNLEVTIREDVYMTILKELTSRNESDIEDSDLEIVSVHEICAIIFSEAVEDSRAAIDHTITKYEEEKKRKLYFEAILSEKDKALHLEMEEKEQLKQEVMLLSATVKEKEQLVAEAQSVLVEREEQSEIVHQEINGLKDQLSQQQRLVAENNKESDLLKSMLNEALQKTAHYESERDKLDQKLKRTIDMLREAEKQKGRLHGIIQEKQNTISLAVASEQKQRRRMESIIFSLQELSNAMVAFEHKVTANIIQNNSRLKQLLDYQHKPLIQQANLLGRKWLLDKQRLERRCSDLQKAEAEVDLLGDEVEALLSLLEKIYIALDHYSPILQHYPGIMEILKLVRRELKGETAKPV